jgi:hypothetical protein
MMTLQPGYTNCGAIEHGESDCRQRQGASFMAEARDQLVLRGGRFGRSSRPSAAVVDFDEAGRQLLARLGALPDESLKRKGGGAVANRIASLNRSCREYTSLNKIWEPESAGAAAAGAVFVGSLEAATNLQLLRSHNITHVVNCMARPSANRLQGDGITYLDFPVERWRATVLAHAMHPDPAAPRAAAAAGNASNDAHHAAIRALFAPVMAFANAAVEGGGGVLIHCFAGAHRAGTTGVAFLMHALRLPAAAALATAQQLRPAIDPQAHGDLYPLLELLEETLGTGDQGSGGSEAGQEPGSAIGLVGGRRECHAAAAAAAVQV